VSLEAIRHLSPLFPAQFPGIRAEESRLPAKKVNMLKNRWTAVAAGRRVEIDRAD
jgi:hypothetical protein